MVGMECVVGRGSAELSGRASDERKRSFFHRGHRLAWGPLKIGDGAQNIRNDQTGIVVADVHGGDSKLRTVVEASFNQEAKSRGYVKKTVKDLPPSQRWGGASCT